LTQIIRNIVVIDEEKCDGCGVCIPSCAEGAIQIIDGKARLVADNLCDGLGNCLGTCPRGAITVEQREAEAFDEAAVGAHLDSSGGNSVQEIAPSPPTQLQDAKPPIACGCPGAALRKLGGAGATGTGGTRPSRQTSGDAVPSQLGHWPVQIHLLPIQGELWNGADVLVAADCVAFAMPDFHTRLLSGKTVAVGCPKLDDLQLYVKKLSAVFANNRVNSVTVAHMEVPCCSGIVSAVRQALGAGGKADLPFCDITIGVDGQVQQEVANAIS
jgi:NAD-dependent dihydropyrimidine dehydrogenase PreA subunit